MSSTFVITNVGLERAAQANEKGLIVTIAKFAVGDAYDYTPSVSDTKIHGNTLYTSSPTSYKYVGDKTLQIMCNIPDTVGPFSWGEVGLYLDSGELFALASLPKLQNKYSSLESDIASSVTFYCYITLTYDKVSITIDYGSSDYPISTVEILDVYRWSNVKKPSEVQLGISELIVHENSPIGNPTLLLKSDSERWTIASTYTPIWNNIVPVASTNTYLEFDIDRSNLPTSAATDVSNEYIAQFPDGTFASFSKVELVNSNTRLRFTYVDPLDTPRDLESQIVFYKAATSVTEDSDPIDINTGTAGSLPYSRISGAPDLSSVSIPIGAIIAWPLSTTPTNYLVANGAAVSRTTYSKLFEVYGTKFGSGNGSTTFNLPNLVNYFLGGAGSRYSVGSSYTDGLPNIQGTMDAIRDLSHPFDPTGAFYYLGKTVGESYKDNAEDKGYGFDASRYNSIYGRASYVRPATFGVNYIIRYQ